VGFPRLQAREDVNTEDALNTILESDEPYEAFVDAYDDGDADVEGVGLSNSVRVELTKAGVWIGNAIGLL